MGHYDSCREGYCPSCGAAPGNIFGGLCEFCDKPKDIEKVTIWFNPDITPFRVGVYQIKYFEGEDNVAYSYWNGSNWSWIALNPKEAYTHYTFNNILYAKFLWRGILK